MAFIKCLEFEYNSFLMSILSFSELFPASNWTKKIGSLLSICSGVNIFNHYPF